MFVKNIKYVDLRSHFN